MYNNVDNERICLRGGGGGDGDERGEGGAFGYATHVLDLYL